MAMYFDDGGSRRWLWVAILVGATLSLTYMDNLGIEWRYAIWLRSLVNLFMYLVIGGSLLFLGKPRMAKV
jgi:hypothetical protein